MPKKFFFFFGWSQIILIEAINKLYACLSSLIKNKEEVTNKCAV